MTNHHDEIEKLIKATERGEDYNVEHLNKIPILEPFNASSMRDTDIKPREWLIDGWLPVGCVTSLYGDGGVGKSLLALQISTAIATETPIFGIDTQKSKVLAVFCEDDQDEILRRQKSICQCDNLKFPDLDCLNWISRCGEEDNLLATRNGDGSLTRTGFFYAVRQKAIDLGVRLIVLDNIAHLYPGDENKRGEVTAFVNILNDLALAIKGAVLLLGHTPKSDAEYSGSTSWNNAVRSRWFFSRPRAEGDDEDDSDALIDHRVLKKGKSNYGRMGEEIALVWEDGAFRPAFKTTSMGANSMEYKLRAREMEVAFLKELDERNAQLRPVSASPYATKSYAPNVFVKTERFKNLRALKIEITAAMERLFEENHILGKGYVGTHSTRRHKLFGIVRNDGSGGTE